MKINYGFDLDSIDISRETAWLFESIARERRPQRVVSSIKNVIFNPPATIVMWSDGTKTVVKAQDEDFDPEKGLAMAISKKALGNKGNYCNEIKKWTEKYEPVKKESEIQELEFSIDLDPDAFEALARDPRTFTVTVFDKKSNTVFNGNPCVDD